MTDTTTYIPFAETATRRRHRISHDLHFLFAPELRNAGLLLFISCVNIKFVSLDKFVGRSRTRSRLSRVSLCLVGRLLISRLDLPICRSHSDERRSWHLRNYFPPRAVFLAQKRFRWRWFILCLLVPRTISSSERSTKRNWPLDRRGGGGASHTEINPPCQKVTGVETDVLIKI